MIIIIIVSISVFGYAIWQVIGAFTTPEDLHYLSSFDNDDALRIEQNIKTIKRSLKDLELEDQLGKIDPQDYAILKKELIDQWAALEKERDSKVAKTKSPSPKASRICLNCNTMIEDASANFCSNCGAKLWRNYFSSW